VKNLRNTYLFILFIFFTACEPQVTFDEPQPDDTDNLKKFPSKLQGEYESLKDNSILLISDQTILRTINFDFKAHIDSLDNNLKISGDTVFDIESDEKTLIIRTGDTISFNFRYVDTLFQINHDNVVRKLKGFYFINHKYDQDRWEVKKIQLAKGQLTISSISSEAEIENLQMITESPQDTVSPYHITTTKKQFKKFVRNEGFQNTETFVRRK